LQVTNANGSEQVQAGDVIVTLAGQRNVRPATFLRNRKPGEKVEIGLLRGGQTEAVEVALVARTRMTPTLRFVANPTAEQLRIRNGWLTGK
jgi:C-terminal processing protease CtpA/Prc